MFLSLALLATLAGQPGAAAPSDTLTAAETLQQGVSTTSPDAALRQRAFTLSPDVALLGPALGGGFEVQVAPHPVQLGLASVPDPVGPRRAVPAPPSPDPEPQLIDYSDAYFTRLTIHKWASYLMLPLFAGEYVVGQKLINGQGSDQLRGIHGALAGSIAGLFAVNTVTGGLNTIEAWKDPEGRTRRTLHSALMLLADAGFVLTASMAHGRERESGQLVAPNNTSHRNMAIASMATAVIGYSIMLPIFGNH
jgi:hypothetical protein